jgi:hypothetical protein
MRERDTTGVMDRPIGRFTTLRQEIHHEKVYHN